jgi:hypothetical protein
MEQFEFPYLFEHLSAGFHRFQILSKTCRERVSCEEYLLHLFSGIGSGIYSFVVEAVTFHISPSQNFLITGLMF